LNNAKDFYKRASYVQKRKIAKILFLNIKIDHEKRLQIKVKPELETLFNPNWWDNPVKGLTSLYLPCFEFPDELERTLGKLRKLIV
jgi:hypothetical protein